MALLGVHPHTKRWPMHSETQAVSKQQIAWQEIFLSIVIVLLVAVVMQIYGWEKKYIYINK